MTLRGQVRHAFPAYRVFIFGIDVTSDTLSVKVDWSKGRSPYKCTIELANELDKYIFTTNDLVNVGNLVNEAFTDLLELRDVEEVNVEDIPALSEQEIDTTLREVGANLSIEPEVKRRVLEAKLFIRQKDIQGREIDGTLSNLPILKGDAFRYPFQAEDPIFHPNDPIRIFYRDPFVPSKWYHMFAGLVSDFDDSVDENNQKILTISGEGPLKRFRYARTTISPGVSDAKDVTRATVDLVNRSAWANGFENLTLPEFVFVMVFGHDPDRQISPFSIPNVTPNGPNVNTVGRFKGVGNYNFKRSGVIQFGGVSSNKKDPLSLNSVPLTKVSDLAVYQSIIDHEVKESDLLEMIVEGAEGEVTPTINSEKQNMRKDDKGNILPEDIIVFIGSHPEIYDVEGGRIIMLIPESFHPSINREVLLKDVNKNFAPLTTEFRSRLGILYDVVERSEFVLYESPKGDILIEFPLYDFDPDDWNQNVPIDDGRLVSVSHHELIDGSVKPLSTITRGPFLLHYVISKSDTYNFSKQISDEKVRTQVMAYWSNIKGFTPAGSSQKLGQLASVTLDHLVPLYGLRSEQISVNALVPNEKAAQLLANISINKMNADARNIGINASPRFGAWINRPIFFQERNCIATVASLSHSIKWGMGGNADTRINLQYLRGWDGNLDVNGNRVYTSIGGYPSRPLNYSLLFGLENVEKGTKAIVEEAEELPPVIPTTTEQA